VKFITAGETPDDLEIYDSKKFVARLVGMPDLETLIEKAKSVSNEQLAEKIVKAEFDLNDWYQQMESVQQVGTLGQITEMLGIGAKVPKDLLEQQQAKMKKWKFIIDSMTPAERADPDIINPSRIKRIAKGSGVQEAEARDLLSQYNKTKKMIKKLGIGRMRRGDMAKLLKNMSSGGMKF